MTREPGDRPATQPVTALGWRAMETAMQNRNGATAASQDSLASRALPITFAALLGVFVLGGVGFSHIDAMHNATHDVRHANAFPCH